MNYANPVFPSQANMAPNVSPMANMAPQAVSPVMGKKCGVAPMATKSANAPHGCGSPMVGGLYTSTGIILVLYILLVIILRSCR